MYVYPALGLSITGLAIVLAARLTDHPFKCGFWSGVGCTLATVSAAYSGLWLCGVVP